MRTTHETGAGETELSFSPAVPAQYPPWYLSGKVYSHPLSPPVIKRSQIYAVPIIICP